VLLVFRSDCKVFGCISSKSEQNWCFELVLLYLILSLYIIILLYIISYTLLFSSSILIFSSPLPTFLPSSYPTNTCRYLHILIYIQSFILSSSHLILYLSVLTYTYLYYTQFIKHIQFDFIQFVLDSK